MAAKKSAADKAAESAKEAAEKMADEAQKGFEAMADIFMTPKLDMAAYGDFNRKNMDAVVEAGKILFDGAKAVVAKQMEVSRDMVQTWSDVTAGVTKAKEGASASVGFDSMQKLSQKNMTGMREITDIAFDANQKAFAVLQSRYTESVSEFQGETK